MRALADLRHFVIETDEMRIEAEDTVSVGRRSFDATTGGSVTFALEKNTVYVRDTDGAEHKLRLLKKVARSVMNHRVHRDEPANECFTRARGCLPRILLGLL